MQRLFVLFLFFLLSFLSLTAQNYQQIGKTYEQILWDYGSKNTVLRVSSNNKYGLIDLQGNEILAPQYDFIDAFYGEYTTAELNGKEFIINQKGEVVYTNTKFEEVDIIGQGLLRVRQGDLYGLITLEGKVIFPIEHNYIFSVGKDFVMASKDQESAALFNLQGTQLTDFLYQQTGEISEGLLSVATDYDKWGVINTEGKTVVPLDYEYIGSFKDGLATFRKGNKSGFIDKTGKVIIEGKYESMYEFSEGYAFARTENFSIFIDREGKQALKDKFYFYEIASEFINGSAIVQPARGNDYLLGIIDKKGKTILDFQYSWIESQVNGYYVGSHQDGKRTEIINAQGKVVASFQFSDNTSLSNVRSVGQNGEPVFTLETEEGTKLIQLK